MKMNQTSPRTSPAPACRPGGRAAPRAARRATGAVLLIATLAASGGLGFLAQPQTGPDAPSTSGPAATKPLNPFAPKNAEEIRQKSLAAEQALREEEARLVEARLTLRTGRAIEGLLVKRQGRVVTLRSQGQDAEFDLADAVEFEELGSVVESFEQLRASTPDDDIPGRIQLVRWLRDRGVYFTALDEAIRIVEAEPYNPDAQEMKRWLESQTKLRIASAVSAADRDDEAPKQEPDEIRRKIDAFPVLTNEEINLIRVYEVDFADPPKLNIPRDTVERLLEQYGDQTVMPQTPEGRRALLRRDPLTVLDLMFRVQARPLYGEVEVLEDPRAMRLWRKQIHGTWFAGSTGSCASANCHGGQEAGRLYLNNKRANTDATVYTNFYIADQFRLRDGTPLINYEEPAESPLLQMALPRERSRRPHPQVSRGEGRRGWRPYFRDENDLRFRRAVEWIKSMYEPHPEYPIAYEAPVSRSATRIDPDDKPER